MTRTRAYRDGVLAKEDFPLTKVSDQLAEPDTLVWVDLCAPSESDLAEVGEELGLHSLAIEDAVQRGQRAKLDRYTGHLFLALYSARVEITPAVLRTAEVAVFATDRVMVTVRWPGGFDIDEVVHRWDHAELRPDGVGVLLHALLDLVADTHLDAAQALDEELDALEGRLFDDNADSRKLARRAARLRRCVTQLRRVALPMRDIVTGLMRHESTLVDERLQPYYHDVLDHAVHTGDWLDSLRELAATIRETELGVQANRLNVIMKKVTGWAAVIAVPTAVTGFYGQNVPYPGFAQPWGFWVSSAVIVALSIGLYRFFRSRDWI